MNDGWAAGWYGDPFGSAPGALRWWDGSQWTPHVMPPPPAGGAVGRSGRGWWQRKRVVLPAGFTVLVLLAGAVNSGSRTPEGTESVDAASSTEVTALAQTTTSVAAETTTSLTDQAAVITTTVPASTTASTTTTVQAPTTTRAAAALAGQPASTSTTRKPTTSTTRKASAITKAASGGCDPNYTPCVPIASDVDCAGGSGNGPAYVKGPVRVIGVDIYDLDRDNDGIGCE